MAPGAREKYYHVNVSFTEFKFVVFFSFDYIFNNAQAEDIYTCFLRDTTVLSSWKFNPQCINANLLPQNMAQQGSMLYVWPF